MEATLTLAALGAAALAAAAPSAKRRIELSRAKHPSLTGHSRIARRVASLVPGYGYSESRFFGADDAPQEVQHLRPGGPIDCSDGQVLHDWCLAGYGIAWRSTWEVEDAIAKGTLVEVLEEFAAPPNGIYAVFPQRKHLPLRLRLWIDFLKHHYARPQFWREKR